MSTVFRLRAGDQAPRQQSSVTCGAACLTVARMLVNPAFARWIVTGEHRPIGVPDGRTEAERFAAYEALVHRRTNAWRTPDGGVGMPWPRRLGTPPWGARRELEGGASRRGLSYEIVVLRADSTSSLRRRHARLVSLVEHGAPALLYVGSRRLPRHVTLVLPGDGDRVLDVYDPATGRVTQLDERRFALRHLDLAGWDRPWLLVQPTGARPVREAVVDLVREALPRPAQRPEAISRVNVQAGAAGGQASRPPAAPRPPAVIRPWGP